MIYLPTSEYDGNILPSDSVEKALEKASRHIDVLTYNRIVANGFENLTSFQQSVVKEVCKELAEFEFENADLTESVLQSYSINGVTMNFGGSWNIRTQNGIAIPTNLYHRLLSTNLCYGGIQ